MGMEEAWDGGSAPERQASLGVLVCVCVGGGVSGFNFSFVSSVFTWILN